MVSQYVDARAYILNKAAEPFHSLKVINEGNHVLSAIGNQLTGSSVFVKCFYGAVGFERGLAEYRALRFAWQQSIGDQVLSVPRPIAFLRTEDGGGILHTELIDMERGDRWFKWFAKVRPLKSIGLRKTSAWLSNFHDLEADDPHPLSELVDGDHICKELEKISRKDGPSDGSCEETTSLFRRYFNGLRSESVFCGLSHNDFTPSNTFLSIKKVVGFDFTLEETGPIYRDAASFLVSLVWLSRPLVGRYPLRVFLLDRNAFCSSYGQDGRVLHPDILNVFLVEQILQKRNYLDCKSKKNIGAIKTRNTARHIRVLDQVLFDLISCEFR